MYAMYFSGVDFFATLYWSLSLIRRRLKMREFSFYRLTDILVKSLLYRT